jgi:hypothetical protein
LIWSKVKARVLQNDPAGRLGLSLACHGAGLACLIKLLAQAIKPRQTVSQYFVGRFASLILKNDIETRQ